MDLGKMILEVKSHKAIGDEYHFFEIELFKKARGHMRFQPRIGVFEFALLPMDRFLERMPLAFVHRYVSLYSLHSIITLNYT
jgi:hypothetical protein